MEYINKDILITYKRFFNFFLSCENCRFSQVSPLSTSHVLYWNKQYNDAIGNLIIKSLKSKFQNAKTDRSKNIEHSKDIFSRQRCL